MFSKLIAEVFYEASKLSSTQRNRAVDFAHAVQNQIVAAIFKGVPVLGAEKRPDGVFVIDWSYAYKRLVFHIEPPPHTLRSSWYIVVKDDVLLESGLLKDGRLDEIIERFVAIKAA